ncbi:MAG: hypothetical protein Q7T04_02930 [Dehalococcoidia bacterium]|nr:hypothetical protein [Dehalococcoidia bacterium]
MWIEFKTAPNLIMAEMWKDLLEEEGIPTMILADPDKRGQGLSVSYKVLIPQDKDHVVEEVLRKI